MPGLQGGRPSVEGRRQRPTVPDGTTRAKRLRTTFPSSRARRGVDAFGLGTRPVRGPVSPLLQASAVLFCREFSRNFLDLAPGDARPRPNWYDILVTLSQRGSRPGCVLSSSQSRRVREVWERPTAWGEEACSCWRLSCSRCR